MSNTTSTTNTTTSTTNKLQNNNNGIFTKSKRLPIDISHTLMDPVNIPSRFKLFQASSANNGSILFGTVQYTLFDGFRVAVRSIDSRLKCTYDSSGKTMSTPVQASLSLFETLRGTREGEVGVKVANLYSIYKKNLGSVFQIGCSVGLNVHSMSRGLVSPYINPKFTYFGPFGWINLNIPVNRKHNRITLKHHYFFSIKGNTLLSSLEITSSRLDRLAASFTNNSKHSTLSSSHTSTDISNQHPFCESIHYKMVHIASSTEFGLRRINRLHASKWQLEFGLKHQLSQSGAVQILFTHTVGDKTNFGISFGFNL
eukprot:gene4614-5765_t